MRKNIPYGMMLIVIASVALTMVSPNISGKNTSFATKEPRPIEMDDLSISWLGSTRDGSLRCRLVLFSDGTGWLGSLEHGDYLLLFRISKWTLDDDKMSVQLTAWDGVYKLARLQGEVLHGSPKRVKLKGIPMPVYTEAWRRKEPVVFESEEVVMSAHKMLVDAMEQKTSAHTESAGGNQ